MCGGRDFADAEGMGAALRLLQHQKGISCLIHGGARGADALAAAWAKAQGIEAVIFPADWESHGRAAGPIRNRRMIAEGKPDGVVAFPGGRGTADMIGAAEEAGLKVWRPRMVQQGELA